MPTDTLPPSSNIIPKRLNPTLIWIILTTLLTVALISWWLIELYINQHVQKRFTFEVKQAQHAIQKRMDEYQQLLRNSEPLIHNPPPLTQTSWQQYTQSLQLSQYWPSIQSIGYVDYITPSELEAYINKVRLNGISEFSITPAGKRQQYSAILYQTSVIKHNIYPLGYDMLSEPIKNRAMLQARDQGTTVLSNKVILEQDNTTSRTGLLIYRPIYQPEITTNSIEQRQRALRGWLYILLDTDKMMQNILGLSQLYLQFDIYDKHLNNLLYQSKQHHNSKSRYTQDVPINILGQTWQVRFTSTPELESDMYHIQPLLIGVSGLINLLLCLLIWQLFKRQKQAEQASIQTNHLIEQLRISEQNLKDAQQIAHIGGWHADLSSQHITLSEEAQSILGTEQKQLSIQEFTQHIPIGDRGNVIEIWQHAPNLQTLDVEHPLLQKTEHVKWIRELAKVRLNEQTGSYEAIGIVQDITNRKNIELALQESEQRISRMIDIVPLSILVVDEQGHIIQANSYSSLVFGYSHEQLIGLTIETLIPERYRSKHIELRNNYMLQGFTGKMGIDRELFGLRQNGEEFHVEVSLTPLMDRGQPRVLVSISDISTRKEAELARKESEARFQQVMLHAPIGMALIDTEQHLHDINPLLCKILGYSEAELQALTLQDLCTAQDKELLTHACQQLRTSVSNTLELQVNFIHQTGKTILLQINISTINEQQSASSYLIAQFQDITERKKTEHQILEVKNRLEAAASAGIVGVWDWDVQNNQLLWDSVMYKLYGIDPNQWQNNYEMWISTVHPDDRNHIEQELQYALNGLREYAPEFRIIWPDGSIRYIKAASHTTFDQYGKPLHMVGVNYDLTKQKQTEQALADARNRAEAASRAKSDFLANMSHEIRTPMNAITGLTQLLLETKITEQQRDYLEKVNDAAFSLLGILNDILDYSKIEAGKLSLEAAEFSTRQLIDAVRNLFAFGAEQKNLELVFDIANDIPCQLTGDVLRLKQVINNLMGNAIKFTEHGTVKLCMHVLQRNAERIWLKIQVEDTGIGISHEQQQRLFNAFEQADQSTTRKYGGTGLGLVISKHLVEMMGGQIQLESQTGLGSNFCITVPFDISPHQSPQLDITQIKPCHTLIIAEQPSHTSQLEKTLLQIHCSVDKVSGNDPWATRIRTAAAQGKPYQLILFEWDCSGISYLELLAEQKYLNDLDPQSSCIIVAVTTLHNHEQAAMALDNTQHTFILEKPVLSIQLYELLAVAQGIQPLPTANSRFRALGDYRKNLKHISGAHVLLVEDNPTNQLIAREILIKLGLVVDTAENGFQAIEFAKTHRYQAILMDLQMPKMNGLEAAGRLRQLDSCQDTPILAMTASAMTDSREASITAGMNDFISKPVTISELSIKLSRWIKYTPPISNQTASEEPFELPGLNLRAALKYTDHSWSLMRCALTGFSRDFSNCIEELEKFIQTNDWQSALSLAHTIKGLARTIGAEQLYTISQQCEQEFAHGISTSHLQLHEQLQKVMQAISQLPANNWDLPITKQIDQSQLKSSLQQILLAINRKQFVMPELLEQLRNNLNQTSQSALFDTFLQQIEIINYRAAKETLLELAKQANISLDE